jgi:hypothetical protein
MKERFKPGVRCRWKIVDGGLCEIVKYLREGYYLVESIPERRELVADEDDIEVEGYNCDYQV